MRVQGKGAGYFLMVVTAQGELVPLVPESEGIANLDRASESASSWAEALQVPLKTPPRGYIQAIEELANLSVD